MILPVKITQSSVALKSPVAAELLEGALAVNVVDGALYSMRHDNSIIRIEGDTGNGTIASGASVALGAVMAGVIDITGSTTITAIVLRVGQTRTVRFTGALTVTNSATLVLPGGANIVTVAGDFATFRGYSGGVTHCSNYTFSPAGFVTLTGVQTLTNKTLTAPVINSPTGIVKSNVGLGNADNTSDVNKPVSTAVQTALNLKFNIPTAFSVGAAATDLSTAITLVNNLRIMAINNGLAV